MSGAAASQRSNEPLFFFSKTIVLQICALALTILLEKNVLSSLAPNQMAGPPFREPILIACDMAIVLALSFAMRMSAPWVVVNLMLPPALLWSVSSEVSATYVLVPLFVALLLHAPAFWTRVPYYPTPKAVYSAVRDILPRAENLRFVDIGCGFGGLVSYLSAERSAATFEGVEIGLLPFFGSKLRLLGKRNASVRFESLWKTDLSKYDVVYCFLSPAPMSRLWAKAKAEMRKGSILVSNSFEAPGAKPTRVVSVSGERGAQLFVYEM